MPGIGYESVHWDEQDVLIHFRLNDRTDSEGNKVLFVEEIQSDVAQEGRKKGFADELATKYLLYHNGFVEQSTFDKEVAEDVGRGHQKEHHHGDSDRFEQGVAQVSPRQFPFYQGHQE